MTAVEGRLPGWEAAAAHAQRSLSSPAPAGQGLQLKQPGG